MLPSYPPVLQVLADGIVTLIAATTTSIERVVCTSDAFALGVAVSLKIDVPLVYSRGQGQIGVYDLAGAYDVGHPSVLITSVVDHHGKQELESLKCKASAVGLNITQTIGIIGTSTMTEPDIGVLVNITELVLSLRHSGALSESVCNYLLDWLSQ